MWKRNAGIFAFYNFPLVLDYSTVGINKSKKSNDYRGIHWLLLYNRIAEYLSADPLDTPNHQYNHICDHL